MTKQFDAGRAARIAGQSVQNNPYTIGFTRRGAPKLSEEGEEWERGFYSIARTCSNAEVAAAEQVNVSHFRRRSNRYYA